MNPNNSLTPGQMFVGLLCLSGVAYASCHIYQKHFKDKSSEEIEIMIDDAFKKIGAIIGVIHDSSHILQGTFQNLQSGYVSLRANNITSEKVQHIASLLHNVSTLLEGKPKAKEPMEIIDESIQMIAEKSNITLPA